MNFILVVGIIALAGYGISYLLIKMRIEQNNMTATVYNAFGQTAKKYAAGNGLTQYVSTADILAVICQESGQQVMQGVSNSNIVGDNNTAFGLMQIHEDALQQADTIYGLNLQVSDIRNSFENNIEAGACYLDYCFSQTGNRLDAYQLYNTGTNKVQYSQSVMNYFNIFQGI